jgi:putative phosphoesterase
MHVAVLSDTHGNLPALEAVLKDVRQFTPDGIIVAGDLVGGPHPNEMITLLRSLGSWMIQGNSDTGLLRFDAGETPESRYTHLQFALLRWSHRHVSRENMDFLRSLPEQMALEIAGTAPIRIMHGSPRDPAEGLDPDLEPDAFEMALTQTSEPVLVCGHSHRPWKCARNGRLVLNPGAVCGPLNGYVGAQWALLTWLGDRWQVEHRQVLYDIDLIRKAFCDSGLLEEGGALARAFLLSIEKGQDVALDFLSYAWRLTSEAGHNNPDAIPDVVWEYATGSFDWNAVTNEGSIYSS